MDEETTAKIKSQNEEIRKVSGKDLAIQINIIIILYWLYKNKTKKDILMTLFLIIVGKRDISWKN